MEDLKKWDEEYLPLVLLRNKEMQSVDLGKLSDTQLFDHFNETWKYLIEIHVTSVAQFVTYFFKKIRHLQNIACVISAGRFLKNGANWGKLTKPQMLGTQFFEKPNFVATLVGKTDVSKGMFSEKNSVLIAAISQDKEALRLLNSDFSNEQVNKGKHFTRIQLKGVKRNSKKAFKLVQQNDSQ
jgi:hypothetical protein